MKKINLILNVLIGKKLRASTVIRYTGLKASLVYPYLSKLYKQGRITRERDEPPYLYTAAATPEVFLLKTYEKFEELKEMISSLQKRFKEFTYGGDTYGRDKKMMYGIKKEIFEQYSEALNNCHIPNQRMIEELLRDRFNFHS